VDLENRIAGHSTAIHWHGLLQEGSPYMDGVPMLTQCPIPEGTSFRYIYNTTEVGTFFWHSHDGKSKI
jgi:FtsP/CotA-like multicopper oxidase with cupredoxin domain